MKTKSSDILQELDSDDELPDIYNDIPSMPAYLDDTRFDEIQFPWINSYDLTYKENKTKEDKNVILYHKGVLKQQDLYCLKSVESLTCSNTLIWFVNFLLHKDLQSNYNFLKSCLVNDYVSNGNFSKTNYGQSNETILNKRLEIVIKM